MRAKKDFDLSVNNLEIQLEAEKIERQLQIKQKVFFHQFIKELKPMELK